MKKTTQKRIKECFKNIELNFTELVSAAIWYEQNDMDDWSWNIIYKIEQLELSKEI